MDRRLLCAFIALSAVTWAWAQTTVTFIHTNDLHAHADPTMVKGTQLGGYARQATVINQLRSSEKNPVLLNAGDTFQGTMYFNEYEGLADLAYMNVIGYQAMAVGNHEFDRGPGVLGTFISNARFPVLSANLDVSGEPELRGKVQPSAVILTPDGDKLGVIGATTPDVTNISSPGPRVKLKDLVRSIQDEVDRFQSEGINKIVLLSHCGYQVEKDLASQVKGLDVIVGGHSHTLLGDPGVKNVQGAGPYPTVIKTPEGRTVLVVQSWEWGKVVGKLTVNFDAKGEVVSWDGKAIPITKDIPENPYVVSLYNAFNKPIMALKASIVGNSRVELTRDRDGAQDSGMGDVIADAYLDSTRSYGSVAGFVNAGGVRANIAAGRITYGQALEACPFGNTMVVMQLSGRELRNALEEGVGGGLLFPSTGTSYTVVSNAPVGQKIQNLVIAGAPVEDERIYTVTMNNFSAQGGDHHITLANAKGRRTDTGIIDLDAVLAYLKSHNPISTLGPNRIQGS